MFLHDGVIEREILWEKVEELSKSLFSFNFNKFIFFLNEIYLITKNELGYYDWIWIKKFFFIYSIIYKIKKFVYIILFHFCIKLHSHITL